MDRFQLYFSYGQVMFFDGSVLPGHAWTEAHYNQGFARTAAAVSLRTLQNYGVAEILLVFGSYTPQPALIRVIAVPFQCQSGTVMVSGPEEFVMHAFWLKEGYYRVTFAQEFLGDEDAALQERIFIFIEEMPQLVPVSEILVADASLCPAYPLIEDAKTA